MYNIFWAVFPSTHPNRSINIPQTVLKSMYNISGAHGGLVVKALCYKPEGREFGTRLN
jgi:hypothetical protein